MLHKENFRPGAELAFSQDKAGGKAQGKAEETAKKCLQLKAMFLSAPHYHSLNTHPLLQC